MTTRGDNTTRPGVLARLGPLRVMLLAAAAVVTLAAPFADGTTHAHDWRLLPSVIAPTVLMMLVFAVPLDITMARVFMADADAAERARLRFAIRVECVIYVAMLAAWTPFMLEVLELNPFD
ncbi:MAG: hypothetical protein AB7Q81_14660 [Gammaproteobacteria bacterium]